MKEALHGPGEDYKLFWPSKTDFVRVAARFNAVVVPFAGIGADDNVQAGIFKNDPGVFPKKPSFVPRILKGILLW